MRQLTILILLCNLLLATSDTEPNIVVAPRPTKDYALLIAVNNYQNPKLLDFANPQGNPKKDAQEIEQLLKDQYGFSTEQLLDPTAAEITAKLEQYEQDFRSGKKDPNGQLFLFFSGHGEREYGNGFFLAADSDPSRLYDKTIPYALWRPRIANFNCKHIMVVIDACYSGTFDPNWFNRPKSYGGRPGELDAATRLQANYDAKKTRIFFTSATEVPSPEVSSFAKKLKEGLLSGGGTDGILTSTELFSSLELSSPRPHRGEFEQDEAGSIYLFFAVKDNSIDTDLDGIPDAIDACPYEKGLTRFAGCPDKDNDGIQDSNDKCPDQFGSLTNGGCPVSSLEDISEYKDAYTGSHILVEGGSFKMGTDYKYSLANERPTHIVSLSDFYIGRTEITQKQWRNVMGEDPPKLHFKNCDDCPVTNVSWMDIQVFLDKLNGLTGKKFRLPTEAEWEYAARGGKKSKGYYYAGSNDLGEVAWCLSNTNQPRNVARKWPNELGLFDMSGNIEEWCQDWYEKHYYKTSPSSNPLGPNTGSMRVTRGGSWLNNGGSIISREGARPDYGSYTLGFRIAMSRF